MASYALVAFTMLLLGNAPEEPHADAPPKVAEPHAEAPKAPAVPKVDAPAAHDEHNGHAANAKSDAGTKPTPVAGSADAGDKSQPDEPKLAEADERLDGGTSLPSKSKKGKPKLSKAKDEQEEPPAVPPSLTRKALCSEIGKSAKEQLAAKQRLDEERKELASERQRLEKMAEEIEKTRTSLREETERLQALLERKANPPPAEPPKPKQDKGKEMEEAAAPIRNKLELDSLAKTMKSMKPDQAAVLISKLDKSLASELLRRMKPADAGAVIEKLKPELAADLMSAMVSGKPRKGK